MPPIQLPLTLAQRYNNQQHFSDHELNVTLRQRTDWRLLAHDAGAALAAIAPVVQVFLQALAQNEIQTEDDLIKPCCAPSATPSRFRLASRPLTAPRSLPLSSIRRRGYAFSGRLPVEPTAPGVQ